MCNAYNVICYYNNIAIIDERLLIFDACICTVILWYLILWRDWRWKRVSFTGYDNFDWTFIMMKMTRSLLMNNETEYHDFLLNAFYSMFWINMYQLSDPGGKKLNGSLLRCQGHTFRNLENNQVSPKLSLCIW